MGRENVLVIGNSGVGKSTLINAVRSEKIAKNDNIKAIEKIITYLLATVFSVKDNKKQLNDKGSELQ